MDHQENSSVNHTLPTSGNDSFQLQCHFIIAMSEPNEQTPPPLPHAAPVAASPPYLQCYYPESSFQMCQAYHPSSVAGASSGQSHPSPALMDPSLSLKSSKSNNSSMEQTGLIEHMNLSTQKNTTSPKRDKVPCPFFPLFGSGLDMLLAAASKSVTQIKLAKNASRVRPPSHPSAPKKSNQSPSVIFWLPTIIEIRKSSTPFSFAAHSFVTMNELEIQ